MRKKILGLIATAIMVVSSVVTAFADTTTGLIGQYSFDGDLTNAVDGEAGILHGAKIDVTAPRTEGLFANGVDGQAVLIKGSTGLYADKYGVEVIAPDSTTFTISYDIYYLGYTMHTPALFLGTEWVATDNLWLSFGQGYQESLAYAAGCWGYFSGIYQNIYSTASYASELGVDANNNWTQWVNITYTCEEGTLKSYVNGKQVVLPAIAIPEETVTESSRLFIGINAWDTALEGAVDNLYVYDRALTEEDINELIAGRDYDAATAPAAEGEDETVELPEKNTSSKDTSDKIEQDFETIGSDDSQTTVTSTSDDDNGGMMIIIIIVVAVIVVAAAVLVMLSIKKKSDDDDDDDDF